MHKALDLCAARRKARHERSHDDTGAGAGSGGGKPPGGFGGGVFKDPSASEGASASGRPPHARHTIDMELFNKLRLKYRQQHLANSQKPQLAELAKSVPATWSPAKDYYDLQRRNQNMTSTFSNISQRQAPAWTMGGRTPIYKPVDGNPGPNQYNGVSAALGHLSQFAAAPAYTMPVSKSNAHKAAPGSLGPGPAYDVRDEPGASMPAPVMGIRLKSPRQIAADLGHPVTPAPGGNTRIPSFARESMLAQKGAKLKGRLHSPRTILRRIGFPEPPAPGGSTRVPSFVRDNLQQSKGVVFGHRLKTNEEIAEACGFPRPPAPGGNCRIPSFAEDSIREGKGVPFGHRLRDQAEIDEALGHPQTPGPGAYGLPDPWKKDMFKKGPSFGHLTRPMPEIDARIYMLGPRNEVGPGGPGTPPSDFDEGVRRKKGFSIRSRLKTQEDIDANIGVGPSTTPAPGGLTRVPSFAWNAKVEKKGVEFGHRLKSPRTILLNIGYPMPPAPGGNCEVPSFALDSLRGGKGVKFGHKLKSPRTILQNIGYPMPPAPGGNCEVPSFVAEGKRQSKGVRFGHKLPERAPVTFAGPGSYKDSPGFADENKTLRRGFSFGSLSLPAAEASKRPSRRRRAASRAS